MQKQNMFIVILAILPYFARCQSIDVDTPSAKIKGRIVTQNGKSYSIFQGIPFAKPPIGNLRFKPPVPLDNAATKQNIDATKGFSKQCVMIFYSKETQSEDCLYLNVYSPRTTTSDTTKYPVMVWIYGGGLVVGSTADYPMEGTVKNMVSRGVIFVSMNYRLGLFGFLSTKSSVLPGNVGFLDQTEALKWVQRNIQYFGGDPTKVTIFGESAGGVSVSMQTISPLSKGLFNQAIIMSGSAFGTWAMMPDNQDQDRSTQVIESVGCRRSKPAPKEITCPKNSYIKNVDPEQLRLHQAELECLQSKSVEELLKDDMKKGMGWAGRIDGNFLPDTVEELMKKRNSLNLIMGVTKDELSAFGMDTDTTFLGQINDIVLSKELFFSGTQVNSDSFISCRNFQQPGLVNFTSRLHYSNQNVSVEGSDERHVWFKRDINLKSALFFWIPVYKDLVAGVDANNKVYAYSFDWNNAVEIENKKHNFTFKVKNVSGAPHATELASLFADKSVLGGLMNLTNAPRDKTEDDYAENAFGMMWTNFAKFGNPTPNGGVNGVVWNPFNLNNTSYLSLDFPNMKMKNDFYKDDVQFWTVLMPQLEKSVICRKYDFLNSS